MLLLLQLVLLVRSGKGCRIMLFLLLLLCSGSSSCGLL